MTDMEKAQAQTFIAKNRVAELETQLEAAGERLAELQDRLTLSDAERAVLEGHDDGCVRVAELHPILTRVFGSAERN